MAKGKVKRKKGKGKHCSTKENIQGKEKIRENQVVVWAHIV